MSRRFSTTVLSARQFHSLATPPDEVPLPDEEPDYSRRRSMQLILDEIHALQKDWQEQQAGEWAEASIINSSKVLVVTVSPQAPRSRGDVDDDRARMGLLAT